MSSGIQRGWDMPLIEVAQLHLLNTATDDYSRARLVASFAPHSGEWLNVPPLSAVGLRMADDVTRVAAGLRLGSNLCAPHVCRCGAQMDARGSHGLSCTRSAGRHLRHSQINDIICKALIKAGVSAVKEPPGLLTGSGLRPDGTTLI